MKKVLSLLAITLFTLTANAQFFIGADGKVGMGESTVFSGNSKTDFSYGGNLKIGYELFNHLSISTGFTYLNIGSKSNSVLEEPNNPIENREFKQETKFYIIPLKAGYFYNFKKIRLFANAGISAVKPKHKQLSDLNIDWTFAYSGEVGVGYKLNKFLISLSAEYMKFNNLKTDIKLRNEHDVHIVYVEMPKPYFYGLNLGVSYYF